MRLDNLLNGIKYRGVINPRAEIYDICTRASDVFENTVFVAICGRNTDGHLLIDEAVERGASCIVCEDEKYCGYLEISTVVVKDSRHAFAVMCCNFYDNPSQKLKTIGITGTNGKTTTSYMAGHILSNAGCNVGIVGTLGGMSREYSADLKNTTPESKALNSVLSSFVCGGCGYAVMEVSSQGLSQKRTDGIMFDVGVFTNISQEHLDYHGNMDNYFESKCLLAKNSKVFLVNADDAYADKFAKYSNIKFFSVCKCADFYATDVKTEKGISEFVYNSPFGKTDITLRSAGIFNVYNALAALSACETLLPGCISEGVLDGYENVPGRMEKCDSDTDFDVIIDFAHTPGALKSFLTAVRALGYKRLITVFGCGGNRDSGKRPVMGKTAAELSDICVVTSDNPRFENPEEIISQIISGIPVGTEYYEITDRKSAIKFALSKARLSDAVLLVGKGHEKEQIIGDKRIPFDEKEIVKEFFREKKRKETEM